MGLFPFLKPFPTNKFVDLKKDALDKVLCNTPLIILMLVIPLFSTDI
jgi:hypothetical protein